MIKKEHWVLLPYMVAHNLPGLMLIPSGVKVEIDLRPCWLLDYIFNKINSKTLPLTDVELTQCGQTLDWLMK